jgi:hypothetical protein
MTEIQEAKSPAPVGQGWTYQGVFVLSTLCFMIIMAADYLINDTVTSWSEFGIVLVSAVAAVNVRRNDLMAAVWAPPIVWLISLETVGQIGKQQGGTFVRKQILHLAYGLANHAVWIIGAVIVAAVITLIRRFRNS